MNQKSDPDQDLMNDLIKSLTNTDLGQGQENGPGQVKSLTDMTRKTEEKNTVKETGHMSRTRGMGRAGYMKKMGGLITEQRRGGMKRGELFHSWCCNKCSRDGGMLMYKEKT